MRFDLAVANGMLSVAGVNVSQSGIKDTPRLFHNPCCHLIAQVSLGLSSSSACPRLTRCVPVFPFIRQSLHSSFAFLRFPSVLPQSPTLRIHIHSIFGIFLDIRVSVTFFSSTCISCCLCPCPSVSLLPPSLQAPLFMVFVYSTVAAVRMKLTWKCDGVRVCTSEPCCFLLC